MSHPVSCKGFKVNHLIVAAHRYEKENDGHVTILLYDNFSSLESMSFRRS